MFLPEFRHSLSRFLLQLSSLLSLQVLILYFAVFHLTKSIHYTSVFSHSAEEDSDWCPVVSLGSIRWIMVRGYLTTFIMAGRSCGLVHSIFYTSPWTITASFLKIGDGVLKLSFLTNV